MFLDQVQYRSVRKVDLNQVARQGCTRRCTDQRIPGCGVTAHYCSADATLQIAYSQSGLSRLLVVGRSLTGRSASCFTAQSFQADGCDALLVLWYYTMGKRKMHEGACSIDITGTTPSPTGPSAVDVIDLAEDSPLATSGRVRMFSRLSDPRTLFIRMLHHVQVGLPRNQVRLRL